MQCWVRPAVPALELRHGLQQLHRLRNGRRGEHQQPSRWAWSCSPSRASSMPNGREMGGSFAFDRAGAYPDPHVLVAYTTPATRTRAPTNRVQLGVNVDVVPKGLTYDGGASINFQCPERWTSGERPRLSGDPPITVVHGAEAGGRRRSRTSLRAVDSMSLPLDWTQCRCPHVRHELARHAARDQRGLARYRRPGGNARTAIDDVVLSVPDAAHGQWSGRPRPHRLRRVRQ